MIVLDTNVISEMMRPDPAAIVLNWMANQSADVLYVTTLSYAEILCGLYLLPEGRRRQRLTEQAERMFFEDFADHVLDFSMETGPAYATIVATRQRAGRPVQPVDAVIAAIAQVHGASIATRDADLKGCGIPIINPWDS